MLCCAGLIGGLYVGQQLGGPWTVIAPAAGFGLGLLGDMKFMHGMHGRRHQTTKADEASDQHSFQKFTSESLSPQDGQSKEVFTAESKSTGPP
jgi:hypothetical protein